LKTKDLSTKAGNKLICSQNLGENDH